MRHRAALRLPAVIVVLLITWGISSNFFDVREKTRYILGYNNVDQEEMITTALSATAAAPEPKCSLSRVCPADRLALNIRSGAANVVGPKICVEGKIIMSQALNNVGPGLNIVVLNGENGTVEKHGFFNMQAGIKDPQNVVRYLKEIKPGMIVLVASFDDVTKRMTNEMREMFVGMGSTLIKSVKRRDSWVFAGRAGTGNKSVFEKQVANDEKTNAYEGWPHLVEVGGCFPRTLTDGQKSSVPS